MKEQIIKQLSKHLDLNKQQIQTLLEVPPSQELGDYSFPCFALSKKLKESPNKIASNLTKKILLGKEFEKVEFKGPYVNFFLNKKHLAEKTLSKILKEKDKYGSSKIGKNKTVVIDMSSPNIAKPFGVGHLRSTIIGNSISKIAKFSGYKVVKINYLGDWGTPFGKIIAGYKEFGNSKKLEKDSIKHLYEIYTKVSKDEKYEEIGRQWFKKLEQGDKEALTLWKKFRQESIKDFDEIYRLLNVKFDVTSGESFYNNKMEPVVKELERKKLLKGSQNAKIVDLEEYNLGIALIQKQDKTTLYVTRDLTAAIYRKKKYNANYLIYEVGAEQKLYFKQFFKILELLGYKWYKNCFHVDHGLYLGKDNKKLASRKGQTIFMKDVLNETVELASEEIKKRDKLPFKESNRRALAIARAAIIYGDLKNYRANDTVFDIEKFLKFEGNTGPYLMYTYARAKSILRKAKYKFKKPRIKEINDSEKALISKLSLFPGVVSKSYEQFAPSLIANYTYELAQKFNEFYHSNKVISSDNEAFRLVLVGASSQVLKNALDLLAIQPLERM